MPAGRPTSYKPEYCDAVIEHMAEGASLTSFAASIGVCRDTVTEWCNVHPEFSLSVKRGKAVCAAWWEKVGRTQALDGKGNATLVIFGLKNMAAEDWREKTQHEHTGADGGAIKTDNKWTIEVVK
jgi:hypothetical protein